MLLLFSNLTNVKIRNIWLKEAKFEKKIYKKEQNMFRISEKTFVYW